MSHQQPPAGRAFDFWRAVVVVVILWVGAVTWLVSANPRLLVSWHGFLHAGIASRFPSPTVTPENPFFAGQPLPYYWWYQWLGRGVSRIARTDPLHAFQAIALGSLGVLVTVGALIGRSLYRSTVAGLVIGYLALLGVNPLGPGIAIVKHVVRGQPLIHHWPADPDGDVFVTDAQADDRMARPLLGALYVEREWRRGQNLVWFFDVSSRGPALALLMVLAYLLIDPRSHAIVGFTVVSTGALTAALNPIIALAAGGSLAASAGSLWLMKRLRPNRAAAARREIIRSLLFLVGALSAAPTYSHLLLFPDAAVMSGVDKVLLKATAMLAGFLLVILLAWRGTKTVPIVAKPGLAVLTLAGIMLIVAVPFVRLSEDNEHNFANVASCFLAVPAAGWVVSNRGRGLLHRVGVRATALAVVFLPMTIAMLVAFGGRPALPLAFEGEMLRRIPRHGPLDAFYEWAVSSTPPNAVLISDPRETVKMSGNVSELPAFTHRAVFVDHRSYMTAPYRDGPLRMALATQATSGQPLGSEQLAYLRDLRRPLYIVTFHADRDEPLTALTHTLGRPVFRRDFVAVFALAQP